MTKIIQDEFSSLDISPQKRYDLRYPDKKFRYIKTHKQEKHEYDQIRYTIRKEQNKTSLPYDIRKDRKLRYKYGITIQDFIQMLIDQDNKCKICLRKFDNIRLRPYVDHSHKTLKVRGLLCNPCNLRLAWLEKNHLRINAYLGW